MQIRTSEYKRDRHIKTRSFRSLSIRLSSASPSSRWRCSLESNKNSKASPNPLPVYRYSSSLEKRVGFMDVGKRRIPSCTVDGAGEPVRNGEGDRDTPGRSRVRDSA